MQLVALFSHRNRQARERKRFVLACFLWINFALLANLATAQDLNDGKAAASSPDVQLNQVSNTSLTLIRQASRLLEDSQWEEAIDAVRGIVRNEGSRLIAVDAVTIGGVGRHYLTVQQYAQSWFAALHKRAPEALVQYRRQVDPLARRWYSEARAKHDRRLLERIVDELFASSYGDDALLLLGEYCLEEGDFVGARAAWEQVFADFRRWPKIAQSYAGRGHPLWLSLRSLEDDAAWKSTVSTLTAETPDNAILFYPDSDLQRAAILARLVLVSILEGHQQRAQKELEYLRRRYPESEGRLAAKTGSYVAILEQLLVSSADWQRPLEPTGWATFAGEPTRVGTCQQSIDIRHEPVWSQSLQHWSAELELMSLVRPRIGEDMHRVLNCFPVIHQEVVYVNEQARIRAFRLRDGLPAWNPSDETGIIFDSGLVADQLYPREKHFGVIRGTLSVNQNRLFAKVGSPVSMSSNREDPLVRPNGYLIGLDLNAEGKLLPGFPLRPDGPQWAFEGTPVVDGNQLYVGMRRRDQVRSHAYLACFALDTGQQKWRVLICSAETPGQGRWPELTHHLVTLEHGSVYYNTNAGAIAAVRASDGVIRWIKTYPRMTFQAGDPAGAGSHFFRDLNPCLIYRGMLICAPADSDQVFALEAATGEILWSESSGKTRDVVHLLGIAGNDLVASGDYLYWLDVYNGRIQKQFPASVDSDITAARPSPRGFGRGLIAGEEVYWPTRESIYVFRSQPQAGEASWGLHRQIDLLPRGVSGGHLLLSGDRLLLVTSRRLFTFQND